MACHIYKTIVGCVGGDEETTFASLQKTPADALAVEIHACLVQIEGVSYKGSSSQLDTEWNQTSPKFYEFTYTIGTGSGDETAYVTITKLGPSFQVNALTESGQQVSTMVNIGDYINYSVKSRPEGSEGLQDLYISETKTEELLQVLNREIVDRLSGDAMDKDGETPRPQETLLEEKLQTETVGPFPSHRGELAAEETPRSGGSSPNPPSSFRDVGVPIGTETPPGFEDEYEIRRSMRRTSRHDIAQPGLPNPYVPIGDDDLYPSGIGRNPPMQPFMPTGGVQGEPHQGMYPTFDHPLFGGRRSSRGPDSPDPLVRPPGARWDDPTGPTGGLGGFGPNRFI
jgi:hypothetical protein